MANYLFHSTTSYFYFCNIVVALKVQAANSVEYKIAQCFLNIDIYDVLI